MTMQGRRTGWLEPFQHGVVRELLCHALSRFQLVCPAYVLMPDHAHFLWLGINGRSNQRAGVAMFRRSWNAKLTLGGYCLQRQAYDHVLREKEREAGAFRSLAHYIFQNPVRAGLAREWENYPHLGAVVPGYPGLDPRDETFWDRFWRIYANLSEILTASATENEPGAAAEGSGMLV